MTPKPVISGHNTRNAHPAASEVAHSDGSPSHVPGQISTPLAACSLLSPAGGLPLKQWLQLRVLRELNSLAAA